MKLKNQKRGRIGEYAANFKSEYIPNERPWKIPCDIALPCATQNEISGEEAKTLINNGCIAISEGANMPSTPEAVEAFINAGILFGPGKAANAGGVAVSALEMTQNSMRLPWTRDEVENYLHRIMVNIHDTCVKYGKDDSGFVNYVKGAYIGGFIKVADAMLAQGVL
jgi:glutamate dehydrogenase/leucine dehydrogenase